MCSSLLLLFFLQLQLGAVWSVDVNSPADWPSDGILQSDTAYVVRTSQSLPANSTLSLRCAAANCTLDCRAPPQCFVLGAPGTALTIANVTLLIGNLRELVRVVAGAGAAPTLRLVGLAWASPVDTLIQITGPADVSLENLGSPASPLPIRTRSLVTSSVAGLSLRFVACHFASSSYYSLAALAAANVTFQASSVAGGAGRTAGYLIMTAGAADIADINIVDSVISGGVVQLSGVRRAVVNGISLPRSALQLSLRVGGSLSLKNCTGVFEYSMIAWDAESRASDALFKIDVAANATVEVESLTASATSDSPYMMTFDSSSRSAPGTNLTVRNVTPVRFGTVVSFGAGAASAQSALLESFVLTGNVVAANGRCPQRTVVRLLDARDGPTDHNVLDLDVSAATSIDVRDLTVRSVSGTLCRLSGTLAGNATMQNVTVSSAQLRGLLSADNVNRVSLSDVLVTDSSVTNSLFIQQNGVVSLARLALRNCTLTSAQDMLRVTSGTVEDVQLSDSALNGVALNFQPSAASASLRRFKATNCVSSRTPVVRYQVNTYQFRVQTRFDVSELEMQNVTASANVAALVDVSLTGIVTNTSFVTFTDVSFRNCSTTKIAIRVASQLVATSATGGALVFVARLTGADLLGGLFEFVETSFRGSYSNVTLETVTAERVSGTVLRLGGLNSVNVTNLRAVNCRFACDNAQANGALTVVTAADVLLSGAFLADNAYCNASAPQAPSGAVLLQTIANTVTVQDCVFDRQTGAQTAALSLVDAARVSVSSARFDGNRGAGALQLQSVSNGATALVLSVTDSFFRDNQGARGAAIQASNAHLLVRGVRFFDNVAAQSGGAIWLSCCQSKLTVSDSLFRNNSAGADGGAVFSSATSASLTQSDFVSNAVGGANATGTGALLYLRGVGTGSASVDITRISVTNNVVGANASLLDVSSTTTTTIGESCMCTNAAAPGAPEPAAIACRTAARPFFMISNLTAGATVGCANNDNATLTPCAAAGCALRVPQLQADPATPAATPPPTPEARPTLASPGATPTPGGPIAATTTGTAVNGSSDAAAATSPAAATSGDGDNIGLIVGCAVGGCIALLAIVGVIAFCVSRRRRAAATNDGREMTTAREDAGSPQRQPMVSHYGSGALAAPATAAGGSVSQYQGSTINSVTSSGSSHYSGLEMASPQSHEPQQQIYNDAQLRESKVQEQPARQYDAMAMQQQQQQQVYNWN